MNKYLAENVFVRRSNGGPCLACDNPVERGGGVVVVKVQIPVLLSTISAEKEMHLECAEYLRLHLGSILKSVRRSR